MAASIALDMNKGEANFAQRPAPRPDEPEAEGPSVQSPGGSIAAFLPRGLSRAIPNRRKLHEAFRSGQAANSRSLR